MFNRRSSALAVLVTLGLFAAGCPGRIDDPEPFLLAHDGQPSSAACDLVATKRDVLDAKCGACHSAAVKSGNLDLESPGLAQRLFDTNSTGCSGKVLLTSTLGGYFFEKLSGSPLCGTVMPPTGTPLSTQEIACLKSYLDAQRGGNL